MSSAAEAPVVVRHSSIESLAGFDSGTGKGLPVELYLSPRAGRVRAGNVRISGMLVLEVETQPVHALEGLGQLGMRRDGTTAPAAEQLLRHCGVGHCRCPCRPTASELSGTVRAKRPGGVRYDEGLGVTSFSGSECLFVLTAIEEERTKPVIAPWLAGVGATVRLREVVPSDRV